MKLFHIVVLGLVLMIVRCSSDQDTVENNELDAREETADSSLLREKRAKFSMDQYKGYKQGRRGWTGGHFEQEEE